MTERTANAPAAARSIEAVMKRVGAASRLFELAKIRFVDCSFSYMPKQAGSPGEVRIGIADQKVSLDENALHVSLLFEFLAPSPFKDEPGDREKQVSIRARIAIEYVPQRDRGQVDEADADVFGKVNGIYNAWPYLREYVQSSLVRMGLPPFELPLLRAGAAAHLAGLVDLPEEALATKPASP